MAAPGFPTHLVRPPGAHRPSSIVTDWGRWLVPIIVLTTLVTLLRARIGLLQLPRPDPAAWGDFFFIWRMTFIGVAPVTVVIAWVPGWLPERIALRVPLLALVCIAAAALGAGLQQLWTFLISGEIMAARFMNVQLHTLLVLGCLLALLFEFRRLADRAQDAIHRAELDRIQIEAELAEGRLQVLQAQIEPHFIFNSLANVRRLLRTDGAAGRAMLSDMLRYLESALPRLRDDTPTLTREIDLARSFLAVHQVRMGARLAVEFDIAPDLLEQRIPPMMLLTLIENALKHGLAPLAEGGTIRVEARASIAGLRLIVADTGVGLSEGLGHGTGLANIVARLKAMYGHRASLRFVMNNPRGTIATLELPFA